MKKFCNVVIFRAQTFLSEPTRYFTHYQLNYKFKIRFRLAFIRIENTLKMTLKFETEEIENIFHVFILNLFLSRIQRRKYISFAVMIGKNLLHDSHSKKLS